MYEMQGPRQAGQRYPPIAPAGWFAGAIGDPHAVRPATGPGHLAGVPVARSPSLNPALLLDPRGCPQVTQSLPRARSFPQACPGFPPGRESRPEPSRSFFQVSRSYPQDSRSLLRVVPVFAGREVLQPPPLAAQVGSQNIFMILLPSTGCPLLDRCCPQLAAISTGVIHSACAQAGRPRTRASCG